MEHSKHIWNGPVFDFTKDDLNKVNRHISNHGTNKLEHTELLNFRKIFGDVHKLLLYRHQYSS